MDYSLPSTEDRAIWDIWLSMFRQPCMAVGDELGIFQHLSLGPSTAAEVSEKLTLDARGTEVVLRMLEALALLTCGEGDRFAITDLARTYLLPSSPNYWGPLLRTLGKVQGPHEALLKALKRTEDARPADVWKAAAMPVEVAERISRIMHCHSLPAAIGVARKGGFDSAERVLDVGGGSGCFAIAIAQHFPRIRCTVVDLPAVCTVAQRYIAEGKVDDRVDVMPLDMFREPWPRGYDVVFMSNIFHDWPPTTNGELARSAFAALEPGGRIVLHEMLLAEGKPTPATTAAFSVLMLLGTRGRQYSLAELTGFLSGAGFVDVRASESYGYYSTVTASKPK